MTGLKSRAETKNRYLPSLEKTGDPAAYQPSVTSTVLSCSSEYRYTLLSASTSWREYAIHLESGDQEKSRISHAFAWLTSVTFFVATSTNCRRSFLSDQRTFLPSGD